jgi:hypothetical protein
MANSSQTRRASRLATLKQDCQHLVEAYWFRPGGQLSIGVCRIFIFCGVLHALLWTIWRIFRGGSPKQFVRYIEEVTFIPKGLVRIWPGDAPNEVSIYILTAVALISTVMSVIGLFTRAAMPVSVLTSLFLASLWWSSTFSWSHPRVVIFLAALAFMFARADASLSLDILVRRSARHKSTDPETFDLWWPTLSAQLTTTLFIFSAGFTKLMAADFTPDWALSDNMRNSIANAWMTAAETPPAYIVAITESPVLYKTIGLVHLFSQFLPALAVFSTRKPVLRLAEGLIFAFSVLGLRIVMGPAHWYWQWLFLVPLFIDWDYFRTRWVSRRGQNVVIPQCGRSPGQLQFLAVLFFVSVFTAYQAASVIFNLQQTHRIYPFSSARFYADIKALKPYHLHLPWPFKTGEYWVSMSGQHSWKLVSLDLDSSRLHVEPDPKKIAAALRSKVGWVKRIAEAEAGLTSIKYIGLTTTWWHFPPYPNSVSRVEILSGLRGVQELPTGMFFSARTRLEQEQKTGRSYLQVDTEGYLNPEITFLAYDDSIRILRPKPKVLTGKYVGDKFYFDPLPAGRHYIMTIVSEPDGSRNWMFYGVEVGDFRPMARLLSDFKGSDGVVPTYNLLEEE